MEQEQYGRTPSPYADSEDLGRSFEGQGTPTYGGDLGVSFEKHNSSPELWTDHRKKSHLWIWIIILLAVLLTAFLIMRLTHGTAKPATGAAGGSGGGAAAGASGGGRGQMGPASITAAQSTTGNINIYDNALGTVTPVFTVTLYSQVTGKVESVHYKEGQVVRKGQPLVDIDPRPYEATLAQAKGTLQHDQAVLAQARIDLARYSAAYARNAIAKQTLDDQEQTVIQDEGTVQTDLGTVQYDQVELSYCHITAPISGRVGLRLVDPGNTVFSGSSSTLVVITQLQPITVVFNISEDDLPGVQTQLKGGRVLEVDAFDRSNYKQIESGKLTSLDNQIDTTTGTVKFRGTFPNKNAELFPNQFVNARLHVRTLNNTVLVPTEAVQHNGTAAFVYLINPGEKDTAKVAVQPVTVTTSNEKQSAVEGLNSGVTVATSGFDRLENGAQVKIAQTNSGKKKDATASPAGTPAS